MNVATLTPIQQAAIEYRAERDRKGRRDPTTFDHPSAAAIGEYNGRGGKPPASGHITPAPARTSRFYSAASLKDKPVPSREWLVPDLVPQKTVTLFGGDGGTGKSLLALQLAVAAAAGGKWLGRPVQYGSVIFISAEDDEDELHRRTDDILRSTGKTYDDLSDLTLRSLAGEDALLAVETEVALIQSTLFDELDLREG
jgi:Mrp family chromosome partitioning ATPase